jgi:hypothetical protein
MTNESAGLDLDALEREASAVVGLVDDEAVVPAGPVLALIQRLREEAEADVQLGQLERVREAALRYLETEAIEQSAPASEPELLSSGAAILDKTTRELHAALTALEEKP